MAGRLTLRGPGALAALTLLVLALHLGLLGSARQMLQGWQPASPEPERINAVFVRALKPAAPPPALQTTPQGSAGAPGEDVLKSKPRLAAPRAPGLDRLGPADRLAPQSPPEIEALDAPQSLQLPETPGPFVPGLEWPLSTEMRFQLTGNYRGPVYGQAKVQWLRDGAHYQVHLEATIGPSIAPLMSRRLSSDGLITSRGLRPQRFDEVTGGLAGGNRHATLRFDNGGVFLADGRREPSDEVAQDAASQFVQMTWMFLTGREKAQGDWLVQLPLVLPRHVHLWRYRVRELEEITTPMGSIEAWHVDSDMQDTYGDMETEMWLAPSLQYLPVRIRIWQNRAKGNNTYIDLALKEAPLQAMPAAASAPASSVPASAGDISR